MRVAGLLCILLALGVGVLWPWAQLSFGGNELVRLELAQLRNGGDVASFSADKADNPIRVRFQATYLVGAKLPPVKIPVQVLITDREGALLTGIISFSTKGIETGPEQGNVRGSQSLDFNILNDGTHQLALSLAPNSNDGGITRPDIDTVTAVVIANAPGINDDYKALAAVLALVGFYLFMRSRRRKKEDKNNTPKRWGRG